MRIDDGEDEEDGNALSPPLFPRAQWTVLGSMPDQRGLRQTLGALSS